MRPGVDVSRGREVPPASSTLGPLPRSSPPPVPISGPGPVDGAPVVTAAPPPPWQRPVPAEPEGALLALPLVVGLLNLVAPYLYRCLAALERHDSPVLEVYVAICRCVSAQGKWGFPGVQSLSPRHPSLSLHVLCPHRNLILKTVILGILCYHWLGRRVGTLKDQVRVGLGGAGGSVRGCPGRRDGVQGWRLTAAPHASLT